MSLNKYLQNWWGNDEKFTAPLLLSLYVSGVSCCRFPLLLLSNSQCLMSLRDESRLHAYVKRCQRQLYPLSMYIYIVRECLRMPYWLSRSLLTHCTLNVEFQDIDFSPCHTLSLSHFFFFTLNQLLFPDWGERNRSNSCKNSVFMNELHEKIHFWCENRISIVDWF